MGRDHKPGGIYAGPQAGSTTPKAILINVLVKHGYKIDHDESTTTYVAMKHPRYHQLYFVGQRGDLRMGWTYKSSAPADASRKQFMERATS